MLGSIAGYPTLNLEGLLNFIYNDVRIIRYTKRKKKVEEEEEDLAFEEDEYTFVDKIPTDDVIPPEAPVVASAIVTPPVAASTPAEPKPSKPKVKYTTPKRPKPNK